MKDVAKLAGVSVSTVSRVLSRTMSVEPQTRRRVEAAVRAVSYRPNLVARGLRSKSGMLIGLVVPELQHESFVAFIGHVGESAEKNGFNLIVGNTNNDAEKEERFISNLVRRHVDGVIFSRVSDESRVFRIIQESGIPVVIIDRTLEREDVPTVVMDNYRAGAIAARHLIDLGHREFACITGPMNIAIVRDRFLGFRDTIAAVGGLLPQGNVVEGDFAIESGVRAARRLVEIGAHFTGLWAHNDTMAIGAMNELRRSGAAVPEDVSIIGLDNTTSSRMVVPTLTTIAQPFKAMCESAVELILRMKNKEELTERKLLHRPKLIVRESTGRARPEKEAQGVAE